jgi:hypothetical protein
VRLPSIHVIEEAADPAEDVAAPDPRAEFGFEAAGIERGALVRAARHFALQDRRLAILHRDHDVRSGRCRFLTEPLDDLQIPLGADLRLRRRGGHGLQSSGRFLERRWLQALERDDRVPHTTRLLRHH